MNTAGISREEGGGGDEHRIVGWWMPLQVLPVAFFCCKEACACMCESQTVHFSSLWC